MKTGTGRLTTFDNLELWFRWQRPAYAKAVVAIVHGLGDHINRYEALCSSLVKHRYAVYGYDQRGHGRSSGTRTHVDKFSDYSKDLARFLDRVKEREPHIPLFVFSHSMGTVVAVHAVSREDLHIEGLIISSYPCRLARSIAPWKQAICHAGALVYPSWRVSSGLRAHQLSHDPTIIRDYERDDFVGRTVTLQWLTQFLEACKSIENDATRMQIPVLILHSDGDEIAKLEGAIRLMEVLSTPDKTVKTYHGLKHELHNERMPESDAYFNDIVRWLDAHV